MSPPTPIINDIRRNTSAEDSVTVQTRDRLVRDTGILLARAGISVSRPKVSRLARAWQGPLTTDGTEYVAYLASRLRMTVRDRAAVADQYRRWISYSDPTGEQAAAAVDRERCGR